jgi:hypothetical protein
MSTETKERVDGLEILRATRFNFELTAVCIALSEDWKELLDTIPPTDLRKTTEVLVHQLRTALGK